MQQFKIKALDHKLIPELQQKIDLKTKPAGSLGNLEKVALQVGLIQHSLHPRLSHPAIVIFAGDHGITAEGVSSYPQEVTYQMVYNFLNGGAAINVFCRQNQIKEIIVDAGVNHHFEKTEKLIDAKIGMGTANLLNSAAMTRIEAETALEKGAQIIREIHEQGCNVIGFGEMGIGNTSSASAIVHCVTNLPLTICVGAGTGLNSDGIKHKIEVITRAVERHKINNQDAIEILSTFGGYEIAMMTGAYLQAAELQMLILVDGFIATGALLVAQKLYPQVIDYCIFSHMSNEKGHQAACEYLQAKPLLNLEMRLGEGTGVALAYPLIQAAVNMLNEMASFDEANVSHKTNI